MGEEIVVNNSITKRSQRLGRRRSRRRRPEEGAEEGDKKWRKTRHRKNEKKVRIEEEVK